MTKELIVDYSFPKHCCGPHWMCQKHHAEAMKKIGAWNESGFVRTEEEKVNYGA